MQIRLAENLKKLRKEKCLTQFSLAEAANISEVTVRKIETCNQWPSENKIMQLANALDVDVCKLFLPVSDSLEIPQDIELSLKTTITEKYRNFVNQTIDDFLG